MVMELPLGLEMLDSSNNEAAHSQHAVSCMHCVRVR